MYTCIYIYIYVERERHVYMYAYIYIYICIKQSQAVGSVPSQVCHGGRRFQPVVQNIV